MGHASSRPVRHLDPNLFGVLYGMKYGVPAIPEGGSVVNVSSIAGLMAFPTYGAYVASKWAMIGLSKAAAVELGPRKIRVNCVCPGTIDTPIDQQAGAEADLVIVSTIAPLGWIGTPEEVAAAIHFLAADHASHVTGTAIEVDGGWLYSARPDQYAPRNASATTACDSSKRC